MGLFDSVVSTVGGYKKIDDLLYKTIFDGYQEFQHSYDYIALFKYPDSLIIKRSYEVLKAEYSRWGSGVRYTNDMTQEEIRTLKELLNRVIDLPEIVHVLRSRLPKLSADYGPASLCGGIGGTWYLGEHKYEIYDPSNEIDPNDVAYARSLGFPI